ncbi:MAG TPA: hypothetical protein VMU81_04265 [Acetobacteraceae bacterium]|nr:hypothetical protein [Acetobacteraceae bacterium]
MSEVVIAIRMHLAAIKTAHLSCGRLLRRAAVRGVLRLRLATRPAPESAIGARDRAILQPGFGAALRRSESLRV